LPTPLSPVIRTFAELCAARSAIESSSVIALLATTTFWGFENLMHHGR
jgi:hypothetical protein